MLGTKPQVLRLRLDLWPAQFLPLFTSSLPLFKSSPVVVLLRRSQCEDDAYYSHPLELVDMKGFEAPNWFRNSPKYQLEAAACFHEEVQGIEDSQCNSGKCLDDLIFRQLPCGLCYYAPPES